ncbi:hypothetical protein HMI54_003806 [Coelomomyces lativittatus]|nr:hypothetical protein HMI54_003806 [Coelomomyces lativittatus]KAJ1515707.1 hypothetical protein HMI56_001901 [Coelomomyces lativittatus]
MSQLAGQALKFLDCPITKYPARNLYFILTRLPLNGKGAKLRPISYRDDPARENAFFQINSSILNFDDLRKSKVYAQFYENNNLKHTNILVLHELGKRPWELLAPFSEPSTSFSSLKEVPPKDS